MQKIAQKVADLIPLGYLLGCLHSKLISRWVLKSFGFSLRKMTMFSDNVLSPEKSYLIVLLFSSVVMGTHKSVLLAF